MFGLRKQNKRIYLDYASTTPIDPEVFSVMEPFLKNKFANPSSLYLEGVENKKHIDEGRKKVANILNARQEDIYFTGSGTESDNLALLGVFKKAKESIEKPHIIVSKIEHPAILEMAKEIEKSGGEITYLNVNKEGLVDLGQLESHIKDSTVLVSVMYANNEIGTVQPIGKISRIIKKKRGDGKYPYFHSDASQAPNYLDCSVDKLGLDLMTLDGSKIYGPKGVGCLYKKHNVEISPIIFGGGQENGLRAGTENTAGIVGFAKALQITSLMREKESTRLKELQKYFFDNTNFEVNGSLEYRLANNINICIKGINAEFEVIKLDEKGIACSFMTACKNLGDETDSYVIEALGKKECAGSSLRFSMGRETTRSEIGRVINILNR